MTDSRDEIIERFTYHAPTPAQRVALDKVHDKVIALVELIVDELPNGRDRALALTSLEDTRMKINKAVIFSNLE